MNIVIIGIGNVGLNLLNCFIKHDLNVVQIAGRDQNKLKSYSEKYNVDYTNDLNFIEQNADLYIIAVSDDSIKNIRNYIPKSKLLVHTSGSISMDIFTDFENYGVFYPLQTFSKNKLLNFNNIPLCIESSDSKTKEILNKLATRISDRIYFLSSEQRKYLHLAAVFANNFSNHMYAIAEDILQNSQIETDILHPLIKETAEKHIKISARAAQTGPAKRNDQNILEKQMELLSYNPEIKELYELISKNIQNFNNEKF